MCRRVLLVLLLLLLGSRLRLVAVEFLSTAGPWCPSLWNDLDDPVFDGVGLTGFKSTANAILLALFVLSFGVILFSLFLPTMGWLSEFAVFGLIECSQSLLALHC